MCPVTVSSQEYLGCYKDDSNRLLDHQKDFSNLTPQRCIDYCQQTGYSYAGLEYRVQCFCGDNVPSNNLKVSENDCSLKCSGDQGQKCGGDWRISVYKIPNPRKEYDYLGCYKDQLPRSLTGLFKSIDKLTPFQCVDLCKANGYLYAGLQYSSQCFCGNQIPPVKVSDSDCKLKCSGDSSKICGGDWRNSVYFTGTCSPQCQNGGTCLYPNTCKCPDTFYGSSCQNKFCVGYPSTPTNSKQSCNSEKCTVTCLDKYQFPDGSTTANVACTGGSWIPASTPDCKATCSPQCQNGGTCISPNVCSCPVNFYGSYCQNKGCVGYPPTPVNSIKSCTSLACTITCLDNYQFPNGSRTASVSCNGGSWSPASTPDCIAICNPQCQNGGTCISPNVCSCPGNFYGPYCQNKRCVGYPSTPYNSIRSCTSEACTITCLDKYAFPDGSTTVNVACKNGEWSPASISDCKAICNPQCQNGGTCISPNVCSCPGNFYGPYCQNKRCVGYPSTPYNSIKSCTSEACTITCLDKYAFPDGSTTVNVTCKNGEWSPASISDCKAIRQQYVGCYRDTSSNRTLPHFKQFNSNLTVEACSEYCSSKGYSYFGLQYRSECYCGDINVADIASLKVSESDCNLNCTGDAKQICGASARNSVYKILKS